MSEENVKIIIREISIVNSYELSYFVKKRIH